MKCPNCGGKGKYKNVFGKVDGCYYCLGTGEVNGKGEQIKTEQEYIQTCTTEQLAEFINYIAGQCSINKPCKLCTGWCHKDDVEKWLKQPHIKE